MSLNKILIVDDDPALLHALERGLSRAGHAIHTAQNGQEALDLLEQQDINLILTDLMMPVVDGIELIIKLKKKTDAPCIIAMSGGGRYQVDCLPQAKVLGASHILEKPFDVQTLITTIDNLLATAE